jgi:O-acetyl-ADP-ribose deacetylase (regulator of RNase III)
MKFLKGNILDAQEGIIGHQVNCQMVMGSGLAKQIRDKYPRVYEEYLAVMGQSPIRHRLGRCQIVEIVRTRLYIANLFGQYYYGRREMIYTDYAALGMALRNLQRWRQSFNYDNLPVYLPHGMGCGLGGGNWEIVAGIIRDAIPDAYIVRYDKG